MKKIIFTVALLVATVGVFGTSEAAWFFNKKAEKRAETNTSANSAAVVKTAFGGESQDAKLTIMKKGIELAVIAGGAKVISNTAGVLVTELTFGSSKVSLTVNTNVETEVFRAYDGKGSTVAEISIGDIISLDGILNTTATALTVTAKKIKDYSMQGAGANYGGVVVAGSLVVTEGTDGKVGSFKLPLANQSGKFITVFVSATTKIASTTAKDLKLSDMKNGDFVISAIGIVNTLKNELKATEIKFSSSGKITQSRMIYNQLATYDSDQKDYSAKNEGLSAKPMTVFVKTTAGERLEVRIDESAMTGTFLMKGKTDYEAEKGVFKWMAKEKTSERSTFAGLGLVIGDKVWVSGLNFVKDGTVNAYRFEKQVK